MKNLSRLKAFALVVFLSPGLASAFSWNESTDGDLSGDRLNPTNLGVAALGSNLLTATSVSGDLEYITFSVAAGEQLSAIQLLSWTTTDDLSFAGIQSGSTFTEPASGTNVANLLGWTHFGVLTVGTDILDNMGTGLGSIGFTAPLGAGNYVLWLQETGAIPSNYGMDFQVTAVPLPAAFWLFASGLVALGWRRCRK